MKRLESISLAAAEGLIDLSGGSALPAGLAGQQLEGVVGLHNMLVKEDFAYLADEVGMGKTYVALGVVALLQRLHPGFRVLFIVPSSNLQRKWLKERRNFAVRNWRQDDLRVRGFDGLPAQPILSAKNLFDWGSALTTDLQRDFLLRMSSFSLGIAKEREDWEAIRDRLKLVTPHLDPDVVDLRHKSRDRFRDGIGRTLNQLLPRFDLVVVDEGHNFKHGREGKTTRNRLIELILGGAAGEASSGLPVHRRFDRLLLLSATPVESDYRQLWNQLDLFGFGGGVRELLDPGRTDEEKKSTARRFLIRRVTELSVGESRRTKNLYRREWREGGVEKHDDPLDVPDARQRLVVALIQKKVSEVLRQQEFGANFQMGMLASFESFLETTRIRRSEDDDLGEFDDSTQDAMPLEREGVDAASIAGLASAYRRKFGAPLPHPKMDSVVRDLASSFSTGEKALIFVRRIKSVPELAEKLCREYDKQLFGRLKVELGESLWRELQPAIRRYEEEVRNRRQFQSSSLMTRADADRQPGSDAPDMEIDAVPAGDDRGGRDSFFAWFFRGEPDAELLSGASLRSNRLAAAGSVYSTMFEDDYIGDLLGFPKDQMGALADLLGRGRDELDAHLRAKAYSLLTGPQRKRRPRRTVFLAFQQAALSALANSHSAVKELAQGIVHQRFGSDSGTVLEEVPKDFPPAIEFLGEETFFTRLRLRPILCAALWPDGVPAGPLTRASALSRFEARERRRVLLAAAATLGHAFIDLWIEAARELGSLRLRTRETPESVVRLIEAFLDRLERQQREESRSVFDAYRELAAIAEHHDLIQAVNFPDAETTSLAGLTNLYTQAMKRQTPVGGMYGEINTLLVRQFRMPGYPLILITTDILQEGEDLHTFCSRIVHYGISWTPSAMEQRTGRIDRIHCQTHRRLAAGSADPAPEELLQVQYPYLGDTVERLQCRRIFWRMNRFLELLHTGFDGGRNESRVYLDREMLLSEACPPPIATLLESAFPVRRELLEGMAPEALPPVGRTEALLARFDAIQKDLERRFRIEWTYSEGPSCKFGTAFRHRHQLLAANFAEAPIAGGVRRQPFVLFLGLDSHTGEALIRIVSPVGRVHRSASLAVRLLRLQSRLAGAKLCELDGGESDSYDVTVEGDILFDLDLTQAGEVDDLLQRVCLGADLAEEEVLLHTDQPIEAFGADLAKEMTRGLD